MLSQAEIEYLRNPESVDASYSYVLKHRIKQKVTNLQKELALLNKAGFLQLGVRTLTENSTICQNQQNPNQAAFGNQWSLGLTPNSRPNS